MPDALSSARAKVQRAEHHLQVIAAKFARLQREDQRPPFDLENVLVDDGTYKWNEVRFSRVLSLPAEWSLVAGDAAHNARSALDHVVCASVRHANPVAAIDAQLFPVYHKPPSQAGLERLSNTRFRGVPEEIRRAVLALQPYATRGTDWERSLTAISGLDNADKHESVATVSIGPALSKNLAAAPYSGRLPVVEHGSRVAAEGAMLLRYRDAHFLRFATFPEIGFMTRDRSVTLKELSDGVAMIRLAVQVFSQFFATGDSVDVRRLIEATRSG